MIVKMKKITLLVFSEKVTQALWKLRKLGFLHIESFQKPHAHYITYNEQRICNLDKALSVIEGFNAKGKILDNNSFTNCIKEVIGLEEEKEKLTKKLEELKEELLWAKELGEISHSALADIRRAGIFIKLYKCNKGQLKRISKEKIVYVIGRKKGVIHIAYVTREQEDSLNLTAVKLPKDDLCSVGKRISEPTRRLENIDKRFVELAAYKKSLLRYRKDLTRALEFSKVRFGMGAKEDISYLQGFCPREEVKKVKNAAGEQGWAIVVQEPEEKDNVPTLIKNPKWVDLINPVFKFMGALPGYREYDISFWFFIFFSLFFAMLIGDAGYGLVFFAATFLLQKRLGKVPKSIFLLMYILSGVTIIWGAITGTWFGSERIAQLPVLNSLVITRINSFISVNQMFMIYFCFFIGAIHLTIAHGIIAFRFINSLIGLAQIGWIFIIWTVFFVAGNLILSRPLPEFSTGLGVIGISLIVLFSNPRKNILKGVALSLADLPLKLISSFSDVVSYLRLFAVGYATVAVATTFNNMALGSGINSIFSGFVAALILFFGHALNIVLGLMAVIVHGIRLNMLEFSGHLNMEWSGKEYEPFKET